MYIVKAIIMIIVLCVTSCEDLMQEEFKLIKPNGGEILKENNTEKIKWTGGNVDEISVSIDGGESWEEISNSSWNISSPYEWYISYINIDYDSCLVRITKDDDVLVSENFFTIKADSNYIQITYPSGGEQFETGDELKITWNNYGDTKSIYGRWRVYYSLNNSSYEYINSVFGYDVNEYTWEVPELFYSSEARIRINYTEYNNDNQISYSDTTNLFSLPGSVQSPNIEILNPNGGEIFQEQSLAELSWFSTGDIGGAQVYIGFSINGGATWFDALNNDNETPNPPMHSGSSWNSWNSIDNSGSYEWTLPSIVDTANSCLIGIWSVSNNNVFKTSQNFFSINADSNFYRIITPNGNGEIFQKKKYHLISWEIGGDVDDVDLYYSIFAGDSWYPFALYEYDDGTVAWKVPSIQGTNDACKIKIVSKTNPNWYDVSDFTFTISDTVQFSDIISFEPEESLNDWNFDSGWNTSSNEAYDGDYSMYINNQIQVTSITKYMQAGIFSFYFLPYTTWGSYYLSLKIEGGPSNIDEERYMGSYYGFNSNWINFQEFIEEEGTYTFTWQNGYRYYIDAVHFP
jgi:hypothetical protein